MAPRKIALLTDSCSDLNPVLAEENHIFVVPLQVRCQDGEYADGVDITSQDIYTRLKAGELPKTSLPLGSNIIACFDEIAAKGYDGVIALMLSSGLSGTFQMVELLGSERDDMEVAVFDSKSASMGTGVMLLQLAADLRAGATWRELTRKRVPQLLAGTQVFFSVDTLEYLEKGGRIGKAAAVAGTMLQLKPILSFAPEGCLEAVTKVRGRKRVIDKLIELTVAACGDHRKYNLLVVNGGAPEEMAQMKIALKEALPNYDHIWEGDIGSTLSVYIGPGVLGIGVQVLD